MTSKEAKIVTFEPLDGFQHLRGLFGVLLEQIINKGTNFAATKQLSKVWKTKIFNIESTHTAVAAATKSNQEFLSSSPYSNLFLKSN